MPDNNTSPTTNPVAPADSTAAGTNLDANPVVVDPLSPDSAPVTTPTEDHNTESEVAHKIAEAQNVLIALSSDPSVDEISAAIGLSLFLDRIGKNATAIYSGSTPNALEFLKPEETFESSADVLQDFVIALNKEKADHLRYKIDGDYVKIYVTPYRTRVSEDDLEFSYGDYNIDLVLALDVANGVDLDSALREHGRIMHDASIVNITTGNPGKFGEIEWSDKKASSISEMIANLLYSINSKEQVAPEEATAFLTGIVAATDRFSNASTTAETMKVSSKLMESGANQQLISANITSETENELLNVLPTKKSSSKTNSDPTELDIEHPADEKPQDSKESPKTESSKDDDSPKTVEDDGLLEDLQAAAASLAQAGDETVPIAKEEPISINSADVTPVETISAPGNFDTPAIETGKNSFSAAEPTQDYRKMVEEALADSPSSIPQGPIVSEPENPAAINAPVVPSAPEINGVPEINYMPAPGEELLPPPPTPPIDTNAFVPSDLTAQASINPVVTPESTPLPNPPATPELPTINNPGSPTSLGPQPAMQDQVYNPQATDPNAFKIPGM